MPSGDHREFLGAVGRCRAEMLAEQVADLIPTDMHAGEDEVIRRFAAELLDELAQVALHHAVAIGLERRV